MEAEKEVERMKADRRERESEAEIATETERKEGVEARNVYVKRSKREEEKGEVGPVGSATQVGDGNKGDGEGRKLKDTIN